MKKRNTFLLTIFLICSIPYVMNAQEMQSGGFIIRGITAGFPDGELYLAVDNGGSLDTVATADLVSGRFEFSGATKYPVMGIILFSFTPGGIPLIIDNNEITIQASSDGNITIDGGEHQEILNLYNFVSLTLQAKQAEVQRLVRQAQTMQDQSMLIEIQQDLQNFMEQFSIGLDEIFSETSDSFVTAYWLSTQMDQMPVEMIEMQYNKLGENARSSPHGRLLRDRINRIRQLDVGEIIPDFTLPDAEGVLVSLHNIPAKVKVVDFWASWCGPCRQENPHMVKLYKKYKSMGLEIVGVSLDREVKDWTKAVNADKLRWVNVLGDPDKMAQLYNVRAIPHTILLDENNRILAKDLRGHDLENRLKELLE